MTITVVLADDHQVLRDGLTAILEHYPELEVIGQARTGREALDLCRTLKPDMVVMDINMPDLNGVEATRQILLDHPKIKIIMLSMYANKEHIYQAFQAGAQGYLLKETSGFELVAAIQNVYQGERYLSKALTDMVIDEYFMEREQIGKPSPLEALSDRERQVMQLVTEGKTTQEIADMLHLSLSTVSTYRSRLMKKLAVDDITELVKLALEHNLIDGG